MSDEQKAKAEEAKAKAADAAKKKGELLAKSQDRVADRYIKAQKAKGVSVKPTPIAVAPHRGCALSRLAAKPAAVAAPVPAVPGDEIAAQSVALQNPAAAGFSYRKRNPLKCDALPGRAGRAWHRRGVRNQRGGHGRDGGEVYFDSVTMFVFGCSAAGCN